MRAGTVTELTLVNSQRITESNVLSETKLHFPFCFHGYICHKPSDMKRLRMRLVAGFSANTYFKPGNPGPVQRIKETICSVFASHKTRYRMKVNI